MNMNWLDIAFLVILSLFTLLGLKRGLVKELVSFVSIMAGIVLGILFYDVVGEIFIRYGLVKNRAIAGAGGFIITALGSYVLIHILGLILSHIIGALHLGWLDKLSGGVIGFIKGVIISCLLLYTLVFFLSEKNPTLANSTLTPYIKDISSGLSKYIPKDLVEKLKESRERLGKSGIEGIWKNTKNKEENK
ncbi:hypothetical protein HRbin37_01122 [bacterium HR37]|nr:hypothetical protein HRbin37_01122 [bacterium HR37]